MKQIKRRNGIILALIFAVIAALLVLAFVFNPDALIEGRGSSWSIGNFALMNIAVFECAAALIGGCLTTTRRTEENTLSVSSKWAMRLLTIPVMAATVVLFIFTENIRIMPIAIFDRWTWLYLILAALQTVLVFFSKKTYRLKTAE